MAYDVTYEEYDFSTCLTVRTWTERVECELVEYELTTFDTETCETTSEWVTICDDCCCVDELTGDPDGSGSGSGSSRTGLAVEYSTVDLATCEVVSTACAWLEDCPADPPVLTSFDCWKVGETADAIPETGLYMAVGAVYLNIRFFVYDDADWCSSPFIGEEFDYPFFKVLDHFGVGYPFGPMVYDSGTGLYTYTFTSGLNSSTLVPTSWAGEFLYLKASFAKTGYASLNCPVQLIVNCKMNNVPYSNGGPYPPIEVRDGVACLYDLECHGGTGSRAISSDAACIYFGWSAYGGHFANTTDQVYPLPVNLTYPIDSMVRIQEDDVPPVYSMGGECGAAVYSPASTKTAVVTSQPVPSAEGWDGTYNLTYQNGLWLGSNTDGNGTVHTIGYYESSASTVYVFRTSDYSGSTDPFFSGREDLLSEFFLYDGSGSLGHDFNCGTGELTVRNSSSGVFYAEAVIS